MIQRAATVPEFTIRGKHRRKEGKVANDLTNNVI